MKKRGLWTYRQKAMEGVERGGERSVRVGK